MMHVNPAADARAQSGWTPAKKDVCTQQSMHVLSPSGHRLKGYERRIFVKCDEHVLAWFMMQHLLKLLTVHMKAACVSLIPPHGLRESRQI
jgi:hypothetical protein